MPRRDCIDKLRGSGPAVLPSLLLCDFGNLEREIERVEAAGFKCLHLDVMDGVFVPNFTYGITIVEALRKVSKLPLDVHLMMVEPEKYVQQFYDAGADIITVHARSTGNLRETLVKIRDTGAGVGVALNPQTEVAEIADVLPICDLALVMSVHAGFGGQSFMQEVLVKFEQIRQLPGGEDLILEIDGGINAQTIRAAVDAGAELLVAGSAVFKQPDYAIAHQELLGQMGTVNEHI